MNSSATSAWKATIILCFQFCQCCIFHLSLAWEHQCGNLNGPSSPASHPPHSHPSLPFFSFHLVPSKLLKNISSLFLKDNLNCSLFCPRVKFCLELPSLTRAIWQNPGSRPPPSPLLWFVRKGVRGCCIYPKGKSCIYLLASRIGNLSESIQASALFYSSVTFLVSLGRLRLLCCFYQGQQSILLYSLYSTQLVEGI